MCAFIVDADSILNKCCLESEVTYELFNLPSINNVKINMVFYDINDNDTIQFAYL